MLNKLPIPTLPKSEWRITTLAAVAAGLGAAAGINLLPWYIFLLLPVLPFFLTRHQRWLCITLFCLCLVSGMICRRQEYNAAQKRPLYYKKISGTLYTIDRRSTQVKKLEPLKSCKCIVRYNDSEFEATVLLPPDTRLAYDRYYEFTGQVTPARPSGAIAENNGISEEIPPYYGKDPLVTVRQLSESGERFSIFNSFFKLRDLAVGRLISNVRDQDTAEMAARLFLGAGNGASREHKKNFIVSGTIHLFSVSGLHVTLFAAIILLILHPLPFVWRYRAAAFFTLFYVFCSGASLPAVRAGTMVIAWAVCRSFLLRITAWDVMMAVWCIFAFLDPAGIDTVSAQYSFGITAALLSAANRFREEKENEKNNFTMMPAAHPFTIQLRRKSNWQKRLLMPPVAATTAFSAGCGISLYRQTLFTPGSIPANLLLLFITPLLFTAIIMKMTLGPLCEIMDRFCAFLLESFFHLLNNFTKIMAECFTPMAIPQPPLWSIILFYLLFFGALGLKSHFRRCCCGIGAFAVVLFIWISHPGHTQIITISTSKNTPPLIAIVNPGGGCTIINVPNRNSGRLAGKILPRYGVKSAAVNFSDGTIRTSGGTAALSRDISITAYKPAGNRKKPTEAFMKAVKQPDIYYPEIESSIQMHSAKRGELFCRTPEGMEITAKNTEYGRFVEVKTPDGKVYSNTLPWYHLPMVWECQLE